MNAITIIDGPYGMNKYTGDVIRTPESRQLYMDVLEAVHAAQSSHIIIFGLFDSLSWIHESGFVDPAYSLRASVVWHKPDWTAGSIRPNSWVPRHEMFLHYSKSGATFNADAIRIPYGPRALKGVMKKSGRSKPWNPNPLGARAGDVLTITSERLAHKVDGKTQRQAHSCQKPGELLQTIVLACTSEGDIVFEPFVGSDSLSTVCAALRRTWVGFPYAQDFCDYVRTGTEFWPCGHQKSAGGIEQHECR